MRPCSFAMLDFMARCEKLEYKTVDFAAVKGRGGHQPHTLFLESTIYVDCFTSFLSTFTLCFLAGKSKKIQCSILCCLLFLFISDGICAVLARVPRHT